MKKLILFFAAIFTLAACSNDFELTEDWKDITLVYGLLNQGDSVQYIRIEKAFLDPTTSAITIAQIADSLYYENIEVELREFRPNGGGGSVYQLQRVNAEDEGFTREDGVFATSPNYLYKLNQAVNEEYTYSLVITKADGSEVTAETRICEDFELTSPAEFITSLRFEAGQETTFRWNSKTNTKFYNFKILFNYREAPNASSPFVNKTLVWEIEEISKPNTTSLVRVSTMGESFYQFVAAELEPGYIRQFESINLEIGAGAKDLLNYLEIGQINSGITGSDVIPTYSNISDGGFGLFSSRYYKKIPTDYDLNGPTLDSLKLGYRTNDLGF
jgi:hypothetical protein